MMASIARGGFGIRNVHLSNNLAKVVGKMSYVLPRAALMGPSSSEGCQLQVDAMGAPKLALERAAPTASTANGLLASTSALH
mmetsp:Transcript_33248/g.69922  ORF Transcript_33248/g.69922 Transcript_33248/m.69922 type:complete len:82 (+) Transcript_33248:358-603(+)